jgi:FdrA protein
VSSDGLVHVELRPGAYADSVTLLQVSRTVQGIAGVTAAQVAMATTLNLEVLAQMGFVVPPAATPNDMVVAVLLEDPEGLDRVLAGVDAALHEVNTRAAGPRDLAPPRTTATALRGVTDAIVLVSVPGEHAMVEAMDALDAGCDVMVFSDNVPVEQEVELKRVASERGLLVMGPDCGTAVVDGIGLGFANIVQPGPVGIVAASGTGCQQLLALLDHADVGVTSALGVGGRDLSTEVGGASTLAALDRLDADPAVELIVIVSKPPAEAVAGTIRSRAGELSTPVELALLGLGEPDLTAAAESVLARLGRAVPDWPVVAPATPLTARADHGAGRWLRGLFVGGTLCDEAMLIASAELGPVHSNIPLEPGLTLDPHQPAPAHHTMVDFGDDALTAGRAHPMIDPSLRLQHLAQVASDDETAVILLDVVLGHGAEPDPATALARAIESIRQPVVVVVVGTRADPQDLARQVRLLVDAGAEVHLSNAGATRRAIDLMGLPS